MVKATAAEVFRETGKKDWIVRIHVGEEAVRRACKGAGRDADDDTLRSLAVQTAHDEGYDLAAERVSIKR
jgi:hypothetical protein